jgi:lipoate-protein ligase A
MRFIIDESRPADFNMAADMYLTERGGGVTVRFYSWARPSVTLGCMQKAGEVLDLEGMREGGADWIRRPTGGRAVLHDGDITYSCTFPKDGRAAGCRPYIGDIMGSGITQTYRLITKCLMAGLERASILCEAHDSDADLRGAKRQVKLPCFLAPNRDEIMADGRKLVGSAQKRTAAAVLQHGSIPITAAYRRLPEYLRIDEDEKEKQICLLEDKSCCVDELADGMTFDSLARHLMEGFSSIIPFEWELRPWSKDEERDIGDISRSDDFIMRWKSD